MVKYVVSETSSSSVAVRLEGELILGNAAEVQACLSPLAERFSDLTVDLGGLRRIDSTGIGVLVMARSIADANGHRMRAINVVGAVREVLLLVKLLTVLGGDAAPLAAA